MNTDNEEKIKALAAYLECEPEEIGEEKCDHYGMPIFSHGSAEYAVGTDDEADAAWGGYDDDEIELDGGFYAFRLN